MPGGSVNRPKTGGKSELILLDTDVVIDLLRQYLPAIAWLSAQLSEEIYLPDLVAMELIQGCANKHELAVVQK